jgi:hypothetical protein
MKVACLLLVFCSTIVVSAQTVRITKASTVFDVEIRPGECSDDGKCGPISVLLFRKGSRKVLQTLSAGRISKSDLEGPVEFVDLDFDGVRDLAVFDGFEAPGGYATLAQRIYLYSNSKKRFEFHPGLSELSHRENLGSFEVDKKQKLLYTYARSGGGVFQRRGYKVAKNKVVLMSEQIDDATFANGTKTRLTTRKRINGRWRAWTKTYTGPLNQ